MPKLIIDGKEIEVPAGITLIQACEQAGVEIPRFCYHERLSIAGNCRMCLVEVVGMPKPIASCAMSVNDLRPARDGTLPTIITSSETVKKAREGVLEFLLINHPLDCPICDQGGECDLQDQTMAYGFDAGRFQDNKRAVDEKYLGPLIGTYMTRCIHCTRCIRFMTEVAGVEELGAIGRGEDMEITTYLEHGMMSELSGNVVDLCPVGALTSKPYAFVARPWELSKTPSVDVMDAVGSNIRVDARGKEVLRILPRINDAINEEWISDKTRHVWDGLRTQRLDRPYIRKKGRLEPATWDEAFHAIASKLKGLDGARFAAIAGDLAGAEEIFALKLLAEGLGSPNIDCRQDGAKLDPALGRATYLFNSTIEGIDQADAILLIGTNPRIEAAVLNARIRKRYRQGQGRIPIGLIGEEVDLTYPYDYLGAGPETLAKIADGSHDFAKKLSGAERPLLIVGQAALARPDGDGVLALAAQAAKTLGALNPELGWNGFNVLHNAAAPRRRSRSRLRAGEGRSRCGVHSRWRREGRHRSRLPARRRRDRNGASGLCLRHLSGQPRRPWRASRRCRASRCCLYREGRDLRQHRRPSANDEPRRLPAGRCPRGLDHSACAVRRAEAPAALRHTERTPFQDVRVLPASGASRRDRAVGPKRHRETRQEQRPRRAKRASSRNSATSISPIPIARASELMASLSALHANGAKKATGTDG